METFIAVLLFAVGVVLIVKGGDLFVDAATWIAEVSGIPKFIVGATVVSLATTLPEMIVSVMAALEGKVDMAVGNAVGSVTANTGLIMAIALLFMPCAVDRKVYGFKSVLMILAAAFLLVFSQGGSLLLTGSLILIAILVAFVWENIVSAKAGLEAAEDRVRPPHDSKTVWSNVVKFLLGAAGIVIGARLLVDNGSILARAAGVSEAVIAVTLVAVGTSLPELVTTITAIVKKQSALSIGNIIGANIIDLCLILPLCSLVSGKALPISAQSVGLDMPVCLGVIALALLPMLFTGKFRRWQGFVMLGGYAAYLVAVIR